MKLSLNKELIEREVDQCFFDHDAFVAYFSNEVGYKILSLIKNVGCIDKDWLLGLAGDAKNTHGMLSFLNACIEYKILIEVSEGEGQQETLLT